MRDHVQARSVIRAPDASPSNVRGAVETQFRTSICHRDVHARVSAIRAVLTGCPWRLDDDMVVLRLQVAVKERSESRQTRRDGRDNGLVRLVNLGAR